MKHKTIAWTISIGFLAGCAGGPASNAVIKSKTEDSKAEAQRLLAARNTPVENSPVSYSNQSWIPLRKIDKSDRDIANAKADLVQVEINQRFSSLNDVAGVVSSLTGLPVFVGSDIQGHATSTPTLAPPPVPVLPIGGTFPAAPGGPLPPGFPSSLGSSAAGTGPVTVGSPFSANYSGSLTGFMNLVSAYYGVFWKTESSGLRFFLIDSRTYRIAALPGDTRLSSSVESGSTSGGEGGSGGAAGGSGGGGGGGTLSATSANSTGVGYSGLSVWTALEASIKQMLSAGGKVVASPATGTITVSDTPSVLSRVTEYVTEQNRALNRQVSVNVRVLSVELNEGENYGINWDSVYANLSAAGNPYSIAMKTAFPVAEGAANLIISAPATSASRWAGSSAMISALSTQGRVSELTSATVVTLNNQAAPINVGRRVSYLASSSTTQTPNVGSTTSLTPGTVQTGFSMTLVPHIIDGKEMLLQYSLDLSSLLRLKTITSGTSTIEAPDISTSNFIQRVRIQSGETLVVAGFDQDNLSAVADGIGSPQNTLAGQRNGTTKRAMLVVLIQPNLLR